MEEKEITIREVMQRKREMEDTIANLLTEFEIDTGVAIRSLTMDVSHYDSKIKIRIYTASL